MVELLLACLLACALSLPRFSPSPLCLCLSLSRYIAFPECERARILSGLCMRAAAAATHHARLNVGGGTRRRRRCCCCYSSATKSSSTS